MVLPDFPTPFFPSITTRTLLACCKTTALRLRRILIKYLSSKNVSRFEDISKMSTAMQVSEACCKRPCNQAKLP